MPTNIGSADRNVGGSRTSDQGDSSGGQPRPPSRMRYVKGGSTRDIPVPESVIAYLLTYTKEVLPSIAGKVTPETALFWSTWGRRVVGRTRQPMTGKNLWRLTKFYGRAIGVPEFKPHDLRHGVAMEMYGKHGDLEKVRALLAISASTRRRSTPASGPRSCDARWSSWARRRVGC